MGISGHLSPEDGAVPQAVALVPARRRQVAVPTAAMAADYGGAAATRSRQRSLALVLAVVMLGTLSCYSGMGSWTTLATRPHGDQDRRLLDVHAAKRHRKLETKGHAKRVGHIDQQDQEHEQLKAHAAPKQRAGKAGQSPQRDDEDGKQEAPQRRQKEQQQLDGKVTEQEEAQRQQQQRRKSHPGSEFDASEDVLSSNGGSGSSSSDSSEKGEEAAEADGKPRTPSPYQQAVVQCKDLACLKVAAQKERYPGQFLFPHFLIIGWQKCATTSLFHHLIEHPSIVCPSKKEPEFFSYDCEYDPLACPPDAQFNYINNTLRSFRVFRSNMRRVAFEGSTHYGREGQRIAKGIAQVFPWAKLIASMREPISRHISMLAHNLDKGSHGCLANSDLYSCLLRQLPIYNYTEPFAAWLDAFPREQIMLLQYESLTSPECVADHLRAVKTFLGLDPELPSNELAASNMRASRLGEKPAGWPIKKWQYQQIVDLVRPDAQSIANIVSKHGFGDGEQWMRNWEAAWEANLASCNAKDDCEIQLT